MTVTPSQEPLKEITAEEFLDICKARYVNHPHFNKFYPNRDENNMPRSVVIRRYLVKGIVNFHSRDYSWAFVFDKCEFENDVNFFDGTFHKRVGFHNCIFKSSVDFESTEFLHYVDIIDCVLGKSIDIAGGKYNKRFRIGVLSAKKRYKSSHYPVITLRGGEFKQLVVGCFKSTYIETLDIQTAALSGNIFVTGSDTTIRNLLINDLSRYLMLSLGYFQVNTLSLYNFTSSVKFKIHKIRAYVLEESDSMFLIYDSNLGAAEISSVNLQEFNHVNIRDSYISDTNFVNTRWPQEVTSYEQNGSTLKGKGDEVDHLQYYYRQRDVYRQLKYTMSKYGDVLTAYNFLAKEMQIYRKYLVQLKGQPSREHRWNRRSELFNLWLSRISTYYGNNWLRGVVVTMLVTGVLYTAYCSSRSIYPANPFVFQNLDTFWYILPYYFEFLNPIHKADFFNHIKTQKPNSGALLIDYLSRIIIAYFVYQTVQAFRKFGKKSA